MSAKHPVAKHATLRENLNKRVFGEDLRDDLSRSMRRDQRSSDRINALARRLNLSGDDNFEPPRSNDE
jgi:hypothetical protein